MSNFFRNFPATNYYFGDEVLPTVVENIGIYSDTVDQVRDIVGTYQDYYIQPGERADQVSQKLYDTPDYHWTFILMNPKLRECGWPLSDREVYKKAQQDYYHKVLTTKTTLGDKMIVGQTLTGLTSGATGTIGYRIIDNGQIWFDNTTGNFISGETVTSTNANGVLESIVVESFEDQLNAAHHYENSDGSWADIDPTIGPGALLTEVTFLDNLIRANNDLKNIRVIKRNQIEFVIESFNEAISQWKTKVNTFLSLFF